MLRERRRIGFFGGSFDPVHDGHLAMAESARVAMNLHQVIFVPVASNPLKPTGPEASAPDRVEMLRLALGERSGCSIWEGELEREGPSYTYDTVRHLEQVYPNAHLFWIIGADQLSGLRAWHRIEELVWRTDFILMRRPGHELEWPGIPGLRLFLVENEAWRISSTEVRLALRAGQAARLVPASVETYIRERGLYGGHRS
ncbi:MAG: hypothetical protein RL648_308 [Verrucomicrobiota bacterium]|jgi:nicotinate-nucleotide adenylyltransferase